MAIRKWILSKGLATAALLLSASPALWAQDAPKAGVARVSDRYPEPAAVQPVSSSTTVQPIPETAAGTSGNYIGPGTYHSKGDPVLGYNYTEYSRRERPTRAGRFADDCACNAWDTCNHHWRNRPRCCWIPFARRFDFGSKCENIALDPAYTDPRDTQYYAAQGYGIPLSVPLAPVVPDTYNYGWGIPSSRLTPVAVPYSN